MTEQPASRWTWEHRAGRFRHVDSGRFLPTSVVRAQVDAAVGDSAQTMRGLTQQLRDGRLTVAEWQQQMAQNVQVAHLSAATAAKGGWEQMAPADFGFVGARVRDQLGYLANFAQQVADGTQPLNGTAEQRAVLYGNAGRATHREMQRRMGHQAGDTFERNVLGATDSCPGCLDATAQGVVPIGTLPEVGDRDCSSNCRCVIETLTDAETGQAAEEGVAA